MSFGRLLVPVGGLGAAQASAWRSYGWGGAALVGGAIVMFLVEMHFNRTMQVLEARGRTGRSATVASAVMLNAKLKPKRDSCCT